MPIGLIIIGDEILSGKRVDQHFPKVVQLLAARGINEVQIEAGATLAGAFLGSGLVDELLLYVAPVILGSEARPLFDGLDIGQMSERMRMRIVETRRLGEDVRVLLEPAPVTLADAPA